MKNLSGLFFLLSVLFFISCKSNNSTSKETKTTAEVEIPVEKYEIKIKGMSCTGCEQTIQTAVNGLEGIQKVEASHEKGNAIIEVEKGKIDTLAIKEKISESGYQVISFNTLTEQ